MPAIAVVLGVGFVTGSLIYTQSLDEAMTLATVTSQPDVSVIVRPDASPDSPDVPLDGKLLRRLRALPGAAAARGTAEGRSFLVGSDGALVGSLAWAGGVNYVASADGRDHHYPITAGRGPHDRGEIAVDRRSAERAGYRVGEQVRIVVNGTARDARLVGVFTAHDPRLTAGGSLTAFDTATARRQFSPTPDGYTAITLTAASGTSEEILAERAAKLLPPGLEAVTRSALDTEAAPADDKLSMLLLGFAGIALFVSTFLIANTFTMLSAARAREHALLRAIGATRGYVMRLVLAEALLVGTIASFAGYLLGIGVAAVLNTLFGTTVDAAPPLRFFTAGPLLAAFAVGIGVSALSAYVPARRASAVPPVAALRTGSPATPASLRRRNAAGLAVTALGALLTLAAIGTQDLLYIGPPVLMVGLIILTPLLAVGLAKAARAPLTRLAGMRGTLAAENARRNPRRSGATATALMIGFALVCTITVGITSLSHHAEQKAQSQMAGDLRVTAVDFADISTDTAARIARLPGAEAVTPVIDAPIRLTDDGFLSAVAVNPAGVARLGAITVLQGSLEHLDDGVAVTEDAATAHGWQLGSRVSGTFARDEREIDLPIVAIYDGPDTFTPALLSTRRLPTARTAADRPFISAVFVKAAPGRKGSLHRDIQRTLDNPALLVQNRAEVRQEAGLPFVPLMNLMYALLSVTVLIGALGVVNTMSMAVYERVREIGVLRALGMDRRRVGVVLWLESAVISVLGAGLGVVVGSLIGAAAVLSQEGAALVIPWTRLAFFFAAAIAIGVLASLGPGYRAARIPMLRALHSPVE
ncbi:ABC transporter permease [Sphaerimonospora cavernae]|uniref:ABC transporter permease n=1 Tax=Sphaerimonospora cavernae TaxID=1740611 RepID=A0ABV6U489_9ACTN